jgi:hypothetical protein
MSITRVKFFFVIIAIKSIYFEKRINLQIQPEKYNFSTNSLYRIASFLFDFKSVSFKAAIIS